jgi:hypothetical protein
MRMFRRKRAGPGQVAVETAITVPMMVFFVLGTVQLGMMHHAQLMTDYAAYRAVRAGIVSNGDCQLMTQAARVSLIPTFASRSDTIPRAYATNLSHPMSNSSLMARLAGGELNVEILNPKSNQLDGLFNTYGSHLNRQEIDFDDVRDTTVVGANLLSVRVRYLYDMRIPFANTLIHSWFVGAQWLKDQRGMLFEATTVHAGPVDTGVRSTQYLENRALAQGGMAQRLAMLAMKGSYFVPLTSTYSMRMQSNLMKSKVSQCAAKN